MFLLIRSETVVCMSLHPFLTQLKLVEVQAELFREDYASSGRKSDESGANGVGKTASSGQMQPMSAVALVEDCIHKAQLGCRSPTVLL